MQTYKSQQEALLKLYNLTIDSYKKIPAPGIENVGLYRTSNKIYKFSTSRKEYDVGNVLKGLALKNVVNIYSVNVCKILTKPCYGDSYYAYIIEQERCFRNKRKFVFDDLDISLLFEKFDERIPYFVGIVNGISELLNYGIEHKDLHSMNVMFDKDNNPKIIDFGICKIKTKIQKPKFKLQLVKT